MDSLNAFLTIVLVLVSLLLILVVLMQRGNANGGLGSAMGGGMAESALGAETSSVLTRWTRNISIIFFVMVFGLYLGRLYVHEHQAETGGTLPQIEATEQNNAVNALQELISASEQAAEEAEATSQDAAAAAEDAAAGAQDEAPETPAAE
ncbi:preprotein translocase subunit SecG [Pelagicoccus sp. SDUM812003]|uniref:preprotein translocase subunit SecG n=1 Tax=Pelagicoccus sp. SDUM812003 TaxID=3041267 RepID=UPI00280DA84F|nr:preprotein translocase subunit SecG [Pelagicoccus sp. SDUM812003]MDQ8202877.1 preprotein translocase subunit SecG [Pelagicoccus sp. SDUM812003]